MDNDDLIEHVANVTGSKEGAAEAVTAVFAAIGFGLQRGGRVTIPGFGTFEATAEPAGPAVRYEPDARLLDLLQAEAAIADADDIGAGGMSPGERGDTSAGLDGDPTGGGY